MSTWLRDSENVARLLILGLSFFYLSQLPIGELVRYDEFKTLDRSNGFLLFQDWTTVYASNVPNFQKPPLQYWIGAIFLSAGLDEHLAMRLPSWMFSVVCLFATAALVREIAPRSPWAVPGALVLLASSIEFWPYAMSGMLETGSAAFVSLALLYAYRALARPQAWWWVAVFIGLGALQKSPAALAAVIVFTAGAAAACRLRKVPMPGLRSRHLALASVAALLMVAAWPVLQVHLHGYEAMQVSLQREIMDRFVPGEQTGQRGPGEVWRLFLEDEPLLRLGAVAALFLLPGLLQDPRIWGFTILVAGYFAAVILAGGAVYPRYMLNFLPLFSAALAAWIFQAPWSMRRKWIITGVLSLLMLGPITPAASPSEGSRLAIAALKEVGAQLQSEEMLLVCAWDFGRVSPGAVSYYSSGGRPFLYLRFEADLEIVPSILVQGTIRGLCPEQAFQDIAEMFAGAVPLETLGGGYVHFIVDP